VEVVTGVGGQRRLTTGQKLVREDDRRLEERVRDLERLLAIATTASNLAPSVNSPFANGYVSMASGGYHCPVYASYPYLPTLSNAIEYTAKWYQGGSYAPASGPLSGLMDFIFLPMCAATRRRQISQPRSRSTIRTQPASPSWGKPQY
jgi:hypothetical protein